MWADKAQLKMKELMKKARKVLAGWKGNSYVFGEGVLNPQLKEIQQQKEEGTNPWRRRPAGEFKSAAFLCRTSRSGTIASLAPWLTIFINGRYG